jgi:dienelactone hydrolase
MLAKDLSFPAASSALAAGNLQMSLLKPAGAGPFPAIVLHHQCAGLRAGRSSNQSMAIWARESFRRGYVVLLLDSLGPRGVDSVCYGPKGGINFARGVRDALQAADYLRTLAYVDKDRVAHVGFSWGAMVALLTGSSSWRWASPGSKPFAASVAVYPGCFTIKPPTGPSFEIVQRTIDRPMLVLMADKDGETPADECVPKLQAAKAGGSPIEWQILQNTTHCWDCVHLDGFSKRDFRGNKIVYRYNARATDEARQRMFEYIDKALKAAP